MHDPRCPDVAYLSTLAGVPACSPIRAHFLWFERIVGSYREPRSADSGDVPVVASYRAWFKPARSWSDDPPPSETQSDLVELWPSPRRPRPPSSAASDWARRPATFGVDEGGEWVRLQTRSGEERIVRDPVEVLRLEVKRGGAPAWFLATLSDQPRQRSRDGATLARALLYGALIRHGNGARQAAREIMTLEATLEAPWRNPDVGAWLWLQAWGIRLDPSAARHLRFAETTVLTSCRRGLPALAGLGDLAAYDRLAACQGASDRESVARAWGALRLSA